MLVLFNICYYDYQTSLRCEYCWSILTTEIIMRYGFANQLFNNLLYDTNKNGMRRK